MKVHKHHLLFPVNHSNCNSVLFRIILQFLFYNYNTSLKKQLYGTLKLLFAYDFLHDQYSFLFFYSDYDEQEVTVVRKVSETTTKNL